MRTLAEALDSYVLYHDLAPETAAWYRRIVSVYSGWAGGSVPLAEFTGERISRLLAEKSAAGRSPHYVKSLRNGLVALLREVRGNQPVERVRGVRCPPLEPEAWTAAEVSKLLAACESIPAAGRWRWVLVISLAYYTGLDYSDIKRLERRHFAPGGGLVYRRHKTGGIPTGGIPADVLALIDQHCPRKGPLLSMGFSDEWFRMVFAGIVKRAGLFGTFKKLRKSSGSGVEAGSPGKGHKHLGNTRAIFERHYEARKLTQAEPTMPPAVKMPRAI